MKNKASFPVQHWIRITTIKMSGDCWRARKRTVKNREEHVEEETERDTDEKEDKRQDEWLGCLEFPKKLREEDSMAVRCFTDASCPTTYS